MRRLPLRATVVLSMVLLLASCAPSGGSPLGSPVPPIGPGQPGVGQPGVGQPGGGPPTWLAPGVRLTWYVAAASVARSGYQLVEEPCAPGTGQWVNPRDGKCYRKTDDDGGTGAHTASGDGYSRIDVVGVDGGQAALATDLYGIDHINQLFVWLPVGGSVVEARSVDGAWADPAELARIAQDGLGDVLVLVGPYQLGETTFDAVSIASGLGTSNFMSYTYDRASGILLSLNTSTPGATSPVHVPGHAAPVGNTQLGMGRFAGLRVRTLPGSGDPAPEWVARTSELAYGGVYNVTNPIDPSSLNMNFDMQHVVALRSGGAGWSNYSARTIVHGMAIDSTFQGVTGATGLYWYSPAALAGMSAGQVLDSDPVTSERTSVAFVGPGQAGGQVVTIEVAMPGLATRLTYNLASGMLVAYEQQQIASGITISLQLTGTR